MIRWPTILFGAGLTALASLLALVAVVRPRDRGRIVAGALAAGAGPLAWNAVLHHTKADGFFLDAPWAAFPISWQDAGSGVWAFAAVAVVLGLGPDRRVAAHKPLTLALGCAMAALLVDIYLY